VLHSTTVKTIWHKKSHVVFKDDIEVVSKTSSINKIPSRSTATYCVSNEILFGRQRSHPCQTKRVRRKHDFSWLIYGRIPRTKSRLGQKHRVQEEHGFVPGKRGFVSQRRTFVFPERNFVHRKRSLFATNAVLFMANKVSSAENKVVFKHPKFCLRRTGFCPT